MEETQKLISFPIVYLPQNLTFLLRENMGELDERSFLSFELVMKRWPVTIGHLNYFSHVDSKLRWRKIITNIGWENFRNQFTSLYLYHSINGRFPDSPKPEILKDILVFEKKLLPYSVNGISRAFMLGLYLQFIDNEGQLNLLNSVSSVIISALKKIKGKLPEIDILYLILIHFYSFLGTKKFESSLNGGSFNYHRIYNQMSSEEKSIMCTNFLHYGYAIGENSWFTEKRV